ncbi:MAG: PspC domain-containing protein [Candidatus Eiseniibacteriota bacterium]|jgi:phage shock protein PspC (stress-responsive transcriptional regulator)
MVEPDRNAAPRDPDPAGAPVDGATPIRRPRTGRWWLGVCAGFARRFAAPVWLVRLIGVLSAVVTVGLSVIAYLFLAGVLPETDGEPDGPRDGPRDARSATGGEAECGHSSTSS